MTSRNIIIFLLSQLVNKKYLYDIKNSHLQQPITKSELRLKSTQPV